MGRKLKNNEGFPASPMLRDRIGATLTGKLKGSRVVKTQFGDKSVYQVELIDADCDFIKDGEPYEPAAGEVVEIMPPTVLAKHFTQINDGETFKTIYKGLGKKGKGNAPHIYETEIL